MKQALGVLKVIGIKKLIDYHNIDAIRVTAVLQTNTWCHLFLDLVRSRGQNVPTKSWPISWPGRFLEHRRHVSMMFQGKNIIYYGDRFFYFNLYSLYPLNGNPEALGHMLLLPLCNFFYQKISLKWNLYPAITNPFSKRFNCVKVR